MEKIGIAGDKAKPARGAAGTKAQAKGKGGPQRARGALAHPERVTERLAAGRPVKGERIGKTAGVGKKAETAKATATPSPARRKPRARQLWNRTPDQSELDALLTRIGWSHREAAARSKVISQTHWMRWADGIYRTPPEILAWLEKVARAVEGVPPPVVAEEHRPRRGRPRTRPRRFSRS